MADVSFIDPDLLVSAFTATNSLRALFYVPQIVAVYKSVDGARDIALLTWWMWVANNALGAVYASVVMHHGVLALSFWASTAACLVTIGLALSARQRFARQALKLAGDKQDRAFA
jgi:hypothetical protein